MTRYLLFFFSLIFVFSACEVNTLSNGVLDGYWHLTRLDSIGSQQSVDMIPKRVFWSVQARMMETRSATGDLEPISYRFEQKDDSLLLSEPTYPTWYATTNLRKDDEPVTDVSCLQPFGINALKDRFRIVRLRNDEMILENQLLRLYFDRY